MTDPYQVKQVEDQWYSPSAMYFRVRADDDNIYLLRHNELKDTWTLEGYRGESTELGGRPLPR